VKRGSVSSEAGCAKHQPGCGERDEEHRHYGLLER
jgi:hypothetical protein